MGPTVDNVKIFSAVLQEQCFNHSASMKMIPAHSPIIKCMLSTKYKKNEALTPHMGEVQNPN